MPGLHHADVELGAEVGGGRVDRTPVAAHDDRRPLWGEDHANHWRGVRGCQALQSRVDAGLGVQHPHLNPE